MSNYTNACLWYFVNAFQVSFYHLISAVIYAIRQFYCGGIIDTISQYRPTVALDKMVIEIEATCLSR